MEQNLNKNKNINEKYKVKENNSYNSNYNGNENVVITRNLFLLGLSYVYLFALISSFTQIQGLWGDYGILPVNSFFKKINLPIIEKSKAIDFKVIENALIFPSLSYHFSDTINSIFIGIFKNLNSIFSNTEPINSIVENLYKFSSIQNSIHIITLLGILVSLLNCLQIKLFYNKLGFFILYVCYLNIFLIGQTFMSFQWDIYLLEVGFLALFVSPWKNLMYVNASEELFFNLLKFLNFKFMFSSGIVKITANCPTWLSFTALHHHFQSQPLPNKLSVYAHFLDDSIKKILTAGTFLVELYLPFLLFLPSSLRIFQIFSGLCMFVFEIGIILTGNYNFFNILTIVVNISAFDDLFIRSIFPNILLKFIDPLYDIVLDQDKLIDEKLKSSDNKLLLIISEKLNNNNNQFTKENDVHLIEIAKNIEDNNEKLEFIRENLNEFKTIFGLNNDNNPFINQLKSNKFRNSSIINDTIQIFVLLIISVFVLFYFIYPINEVLNGNYILTKDQDLHFLYDPYFLNSYFVVVFIVLLINFMLNSIKIDKEGLRGSYNVFNFLVFSIKGVLNLILLVFFTLYFYKNTLVFKQSIELKPIKIENLIVNDLLQNIHSLEERVFGKISNFSLFGYGLFRVMTGVNGRPELEIMYTNEIYPNENDWKPINFIFKPQEHKTNSNLLINIPHQPRIDWQIWFSALRPTYSSEEWLINLCGRILEKNDVVLSLLGYSKDEQINNQFTYKLFNWFYGIEKNIMESPPTYIKIASYIYKFNDDFTSKKYWNKKYVKEYLPQINLDSLKKYFEIQKYPLLKGKSEFSFLQILPITDVVVFVFIMFLAFKLYKS